MFNKLKQIKDLRDQAKTMQKVLADVMVVGQGKGVMITMDGNQQVLAVQIEDGLEKAKIEQGVKEAFADAVKKMQKEMASKMKDLGGFDALKNLMS